ncbi:MAG: hypothetical protein Q9160_000362 [Pyrenula sp. 1 TL-2023]
MSHPGQTNPTSTTSSSSSANPITNRLPAYSSTNTTSIPSTSFSSTSSAKTRQYAHLHSQLAQLNAHLADTENLVRMTAVQAQDMRFLGGYVGAMFMAGSRVLGEESLGAAAAAGTPEREEEKRAGGEGGI